MTIETKQVLIDFDNAVITIIVRLKLFTSRAFTFITSEP